MTERHAPRRSARLLVGVAAVSLSVVVAAAAVSASTSGGAYTADRPATPPVTEPDGSSDPATSELSPEVAAVPGITGSVVPPDGLGDDPELDALAQECFDGTFISCDLLYLHSPVASPYENYGDTCAGRQEAGTEDYCQLGRDDTDPLDPNGPDAPTDSTDVSEPTGPTASTEPGTTAGSTEPLEPGVIPPATQEPVGLGDDPALDELATRCYDGEMVACDELYGQSEESSEYREYGDTCAGRQPVGTGRLCDVAFATVDAPPSTEEPSATVPVAEPTASTSVEVPVPSPPPTVATVPGTVPSASLPPLPSTPASPSPQSVPGTTSTLPTGPTLATVPGAVPAPTLEPTGLGNDPMLDSLAQACYDGDMESCDQLWRDAEMGSDYRSYGDTCAGRQEAGTGIWCTRAFPAGAEPGPTTVPPASTPLETVPPVTASPGSVPPDSVPLEPSPPSSTPLVTTPSGVVPAPTIEPTGLGTDPTLDGLAQECYDGVLDSCDELWRESDVGSEYRNYGDTCAGRQEAGTGIWCVSAFPAGDQPGTTLPGPTQPSTTTVPVPTPPTGPPPTTAVASNIPEATVQPTGLGDDPALDALAQQCFDGDMVACDALFDAAPVKSDYQTYGDTCAGRQPAGTFKYCRAAFPVSTAP